MIDSVFRGWWAVLVDLVGIVFGWGLVLIAVDCGGWCFVVFAMPLCLVVVVTDGFVLLALWF